MISSVLFFGTRCSFADLVLARLVEAGFDIAARVVPGNPDSPHPFTVLEPRTAGVAGTRLPLAGNAGAGGEHELGRQYPMIAVNRHSSPEAAAHLTELEADVSVLCCYPRRLPLSLVNASTHGGINVHPSLLPAYRGPEPLFWMYRNGETESGITLHLVDAWLDTGPVVSQRSIDIPIGKPGDELWNESARLGAEMLVNVLQCDPADAEQLPQQPPEGASYHSWPGTGELVIDPEEWHAWRVFHFCRGVIPLGYIPILRAGGLTRPVIAADDYVNKERGTGALKPHSDDGWARCKSGYVKLRFGASSGRA